VADHRCQIFPSIEHVIHSYAALDLPSKPEKIAIVGGGYIALEFAAIFNGLKVRSMCLFGSRKF